jgi:hypothetical protein
MLERITLGPGDRLARYDVKNFDMEGTHEILSRGLFSHIDAPDQRSALDHAVQLILTSQFVACYELGAVFQVSRGSGYG